MNKIIEPKKPREFWTDGVGIITRDRDELPWQSVKDYFKVREVMPDDFKTRYKLCDEHICNGQKLMNARKALNKAKEALEYYSTSFKNKSGFFWKSYVADMGKEARSALLEIVEIEGGKK